MTTNLIGIAGFARSGKDTVGAYLEEHHGYVRRAFADKLRELALVVDPFIDMLDGGHNQAPELLRYADQLAYWGYEQAKTLNPEVRNFLVRLGAGARQVLGKDVWLDALLPADHPATEWLGPRTVITDVRYPNEAKRIQDLGGTLVYVSRSSVAAANGEEAQSLNRVLAECAPIVHLYNNGTLEDLYAQVEAQLCR